MSLRLAPNTMSLSLCACFAPRGTFLAGHLSSYQNYPPKTPASGLIVYESSFRKSPRHSNCSISGHGQQYYLTFSIVDVFRAHMNSSATIDNQGGDPTTGNTILYQPPGAWMLGAIGNCPGCALPSPSLANQGSFHGSLFVSLF